ncbi:MAG: hypothetical protein RL685_1245 [Pseudomonadota bacterium]|jgi:poly(3-hydroxybutyrate) depolymerase
MRRTLLLLALCACATPVPAPSVAPSATSVGSGPPSPAVVAPNATPDSAQELARQILERPELAAYHGWIAYLQFQAARAAERPEQDAAAGTQAPPQLAEWSRRILDQPQLLSELRGVTEWAYLSPVDGSGQPFKLNIPTDYDPAKPTPLMLYMHGNGGNHLEHAQDMKEQTGAFEVSVLGRARAGRYRALSEADVLAVLDYVAAHWHIDLDRVHLDGGSMGGAGTYWLGARYPHRFASGRPVCGSASDKPLGNLLTFPIYATHSDDDWQVPVLHARGPIAKLRALGADATLDETTGLGHAAWTYHEGLARAKAWMQKQVRRASRDVRRLDFTALDGNATRAHWAEIVEWGSEPAPARFRLEANSGNRLAVRLDNVVGLRLRLAEAPVDLSRKLRIELAGAPALELPAPLPEAIVLAQEKGRWAVHPEAVHPEAVRAEQAAPAPRLHSPGGADQLYDGTPLLIVYGTRGDEPTKRALRAAAEVASHSPNASWPAPIANKGPDGVSHNQNLYGDLLIKADTEVTADDVARRNLVLIGNATQNSVVAALAPRLPVRLAEGKISFSDGAELAAAGRALGLVHYNPDAPGRLLFWVASDELAAYGAGSLVPELLGAGLTGADLVVTRVSDPALVLSRSFDSRWRWQSRERSALLPASASSRPEFARALARSVRRAAGSDFALVGPVKDRASVFEAGQARLSDLIAQYYFEPVSVLTLSGSQLLAVLKALGERTELRLEPEPDSQRILPQREYQLALTAPQISPLVAATHLNTGKYEVTDLTVSQVLARHGLLAAEPASARLAR